MNRNWSKLCWLTQFILYQLSPRTVTRHMSYHVAWREKLFKNCIQIDNRVNFIISQYIVSLQLMHCNQHILSGFLKFFEFNLHSTDDARHNSSKSTTHKRPHRALMRWKAPKHSNSKPFVGFIESRKGNIKGANPELIYQHLTATSAEVQFCTSFDVYTNRPFVAGPRSHQ